MPANLCFHNGRSRRFLPSCIPTLGMISSFISSNETIPKRRLVWVVVVSRLTMLVLMAISCYLIPDHNPGDDVLRFELRLDQENPCFCLEGTACDTSGKRYIPGSPNCATGTSVRASVLAPWYQFLLGPITKWDAARFLSLAADPNMRNPCTDCMDPFTRSEQAHAFFPLFPWCIRTMAAVLMHLVPDTYLPSTYEGVLALSAWIFNSICFTVATLLLYVLTYSVTTQYRLAAATCFVFLINPASVFFHTAYSESLFAMCTLAGHALTARGLVGVAIVPWMVASYARSNGTLNALWLLQRGLAKMLRAKSLAEGASNVLYHLFLAILVVSPIHYHDRQGYQRHCNQEISLQPTWCEEESSWFSLYAWTQRRHWNVGFLRYYEWKQIPNFLLAAPILGLGLWGAYLWIESSMSTFMKGKTMNWRVLVPWAVDALQQSASDRNPKEGLLENQHLLGHYAILAVACLVGLTIAHIQISTRLICSSCPAILWFMADRSLSDTKTSRVWLAYCGLYILLGVILHVNFLPWT